MYYRYWEHDDTIHQAPAHYGYRTDRYKLIYFYNDGLGLPGCSAPCAYPPEWELYDLEPDPDELRNVADDPAYAPFAATSNRRCGWRRSGSATNPTRASPVGHVASRPGQRESEGCWPVRPH